MLRSVGDVASLGLIDTQTRRETHSKLWAALQLRPGRRDGRRDALAAMLSPARRLRMIAANDEGLTDIVNCLMALGATSLPSVLRGVLAKWVTAGLAARVQTPRAPPLVPRMLLSVVFARPAAREPLAALARLLSRWGIEHACLPVGQVTPLG